MQATCPKIQNVFHFVVVHHELNTTLTNLNIDKSKSQRKSVAIMEQLRTPATLKWFVATQYPAHLIRWLSNKNSNSNSKSKQNHITRINMNSRRRVATENCVFSRLFSSLLNSSNCCSCHCNFFSVFISISVL